MSSNNNTQRRTFRGRGRQQQRYYKKKASHTKVKHNNDNIENDKIDNLKDVSAPPLPSSQSKNDTLIEEHNGTDLTKNDHINDTDDINESNTLLDHNTTNIGNSSHPKYEDEEYTNNNENFYKEIQTLRTKIKNIQKSIQTSSSLTIPTNYQTNCLNAVSKVINTWKTIPSYYRDEVINLIQQQNNIIKETSTLIFQLIQLSLQCGPLSGSKPGYFKRCGSEISKMVMNYLNNMEPLEELYFTEKQSNVIEKWLHDATRVSELDVSPSFKVLNKKKKKK